MARYSVAPLAKKLGISTNSEIVVIDAPREYKRMVTPIPEGARIALRVTKETDVIHLFSTKRGHLARSLESCLKRMAPDAIIWVSWRKKSSGLESEITEDTIRDIALPLGLVDVKVCAIDETWSGLKLVIRKEKRKAISAGTSL